MFFGSLVGRAARFILCERLGIGHVYPCQSLKWKVELLVNAFAMNRCSALNDSMWTVEKLSVRIGP